MKTLTLQERIENIFPKELPERFNDIIPYKEGDTYLINGEIRRAERTSPVYSSVCLMRDGKPEREFLGNYPMLTGEESMNALDAAVRAYDNGNGIWPSMTIRDRMIALSNFVDKMKKQRENVVKLEMLEIGKNKRETEAEFDRTVKYIEDTIDEM
ncbi:MAG TPA: aldehyde dehydrogenase family protein, partial [Candidatus Nanoarchaeia archaeon]|nr:aldehyde dehydrogenase family protein [Candidatus Nanoarchaeia archaeon]